MKPISILAVCFLITTSSYANLCKETLQLEMYTRINVVNELGDKITPVLEPLIIMGSVLGEAPNRRSMLDSNYSHFGELAGYREIFFQLMEQVLDSNYEGRSFQELLFEEQVSAVKIFIPELLATKGPDALERSFFIQYLDKWVYEGSLFLLTEYKRKYSDAKKSILTKPQALNILFGDFFIQFFQSTQEQWMQTSDILLSLWRRGFDLESTHLGDYQKLLGGLDSFNPVTKGSKKYLERFMNTSAAVVLKMISFSTKSIRIQRRLHALSRSDVADVKFADAFAMIMNDFSTLLVEVEVLFVNREHLYQDLLSIMKERRESAGPGFFDWTKSRKERAEKVRRALLSSQNYFIEDFTDYETLSTAVVLRDFANINRLANTMDPSDAASNIGIGVYSHTILEKLEAISLQRAIVLGALERFRNGIINAD